MEIMEKQKELQEKAAKEGDTIVFKNDTMEITQNGITKKILVSVQSPMVTLERITPYIKGENLDYVWEYIEFLSNKDDIYFFDVDCDEQTKNELKNKIGKKAYTLEKLLENDEKILNILKIEFYYSYLDCLVFEEDKEKIKEWISFPVILKEKFAHIQERYPTIVFQTGRFSLRQRYNRITIHYFGKTESVVVYCEGEEWKIEVGSCEYVGESLFDLFHIYLQRVEKEMRLQNIYEPDMYHFSEMFEGRLFKANEQVEIYEYLRQTYSNQEIEEQAVRYNKKNGTIKPFVYHTAGNLQEDLEAHCYSILGAYVLTIRKSEQEKQMIIGEKQKIIDIYQQTILSEIQAIYVEGVKNEENVKEKT